MERLQIWLSYTPYPSGNDYYENPQIVGTNDLINYSEVKFTEPPLANYKNPYAIIRTVILYITKNLTALSCFGDIRIMIPTIWHCI